MVPNTCAANDGIANQLRFDFKLFPENAKGGFKLYLQLPWTPDTHYNMVRRLRRFMDTARSERGDDHKALPAAVQNLLAVHTHTGQARHTPRLVGVVALGEALGVDWVTGSMPT